jgi:hypothetical protein
MLRTQPAFAPRPVRAALLAVAFLLLAGGGWAGRAEAGPLPAERPVGSCTPELVYQLFPGTIAAAGSGVGTVAALRYTDASGVARPDTTATIRWSARAIVTMPSGPGAAPQIGGGLDLEITTGAGEHLAFNATCIAGSGAIPDGLVVYANGLTRGWPGGTAVRRSFVHFEAWSDAGAAYAYVALIDGSDCELNFGVHVVTRSPYASGNGVFSGLPPRAVYAETNCARRFGNPFPRAVAPGLSLP